MKLGIGVLVLVITEFRIDIINEQYASNMIKKGISILKIMLAIYATLHLKLKSLENYIN
jgi:hypothetical protein